MYMVYNTFAAWYWLDMDNAYSQFYGTEMEVTKYCIRDQIIFLIHMTNLNRTGFQHMFMIYLQI